MQHLHLLSLVNSMMRNLQSYKTSEYTNQKNIIYFCNLLCISPPSPFRPHPPHPLSSAFFLPSPFPLLIPPFTPSSTFSSFPLSYPGFLLLCPSLHLFPLISSLLLLLGMCRNSGSTECRPAYHRRGSGVAGSTARSHTWPLAVLFCVALLSTVYEE